MMTGRSGRSALTKRMASSARRMARRFGRTTSREAGGGGTRAIDDMNVQLNKLDLYLAKSDTILQTRLKKFKEETAEDHYIRESLRVLAEMVKM